MKPWEGMPLEKGINAYVRAVRKVARRKKEPRPPGWVHRMSSSAWRDRYGKGKGVILSLELSTFMGTRVNKLSDDTFSGGRVEAVAIGMMLWPESMKAFIDMTSRERAATLAVFTDLNETTHQIALASLYCRIMKRYQRVCEEEEHSS